MEPLRFERDLDAPIKEVWRHLTTAECLTEWLCLRAWIELKQGGRFELFWNEDESIPESNSTLGCRIIELEKPKLLEVSWRGADEVAEVMNELGGPINTVRFELQAKGGKTHLTLVHGGWGEGEAWARARTFFMRSWNAAMQRLGEMVGGH